jgi:flavin reductase (DIM6/NTAB) family NADH-FMN oxidoreductase RutF
MILSNTEIGELPKIKKLNIINSITGIKPANLIGTRSIKGMTNLAVFSSVVHMGSNPPLIGMISRPVGDVERHTMENLEDSPFYTINHVVTDKVKHAHYTSAKWGREDSEFEKCGFNEQFISDFPAPFVQESHIKMGMEVKEKINIELNGTVLIIGTVQMIVIPDEALSGEGYINLELAKSAGVSGLNSYYSLNRIQEFPYARVDDANDLVK